nr:MAG TPA: hypothetical protein [Caudoviricetes sp.]
MRAAGQVYLSAVCRVPEVSTEYGTPFFEAAAMRGCGRSGWNLPVRK